MKEKNEGMSEREYINCLQILNIRLELHNGFA